MKTFIKSKLFVYMRKAASLCNKLHLYKLAKMVAIPRFAYCLSFLKKRIHNSLSRFYQFEDLQEIPAAERRFFVMWFQGQSCMPDIVRKCYESLKKYTKDKWGGGVILITEENIQDFIDLPSFIVERFLAKKISYTLFSDIVRAGLLSKYGGTWVDATVFISQEIPNKYFQQAFYCPCGFKDSLKNEWKYLFGDSSGWAIWFMGSKYKNFPLFDFLYRAWIEYLEHEEMPIDYFTTDMLIALFYQKNNYFKDIVDSLEANNMKAFELMKLLGREANQETIAEVKSLFMNTFIHKLTYKRNFSKTSKSGKQTLYNYILSSGN